MTLILIVMLAIALMFLGTPIFVVISGLTLFLFFDSQIDISAIIIEMHRMATTPVLVAIPLFTFAGYMLSESGAPKRLIRLSNAILGWMPGGLAIIALVCCAIFTALTGATGLTIIALGGILLPAMVRSRYPELFSLGLLTTSGTLGLLFVLPVIGGAYLGQWLDSLSEGYSIRWTIGLIIAGIVVGGLNAYLFIREQP